MSATRFLLVRHGETDWNAVRRFQGWTDRPLSEKGRKQAEAVAEALRSAEVSAVVASDLSRARETAERIASAAGVPLSLDRDLREGSFGIWEGLTFEEIRTGHPDAFAAWQSDAVRNGPPEGESIGTLVARVGSAVDRLRAQHGERTIAVVSHGGALQALLCRALGVAPRARWPFWFEPASVSELLFTEGGPVLLRLNDTAHLRAPAGP